MFGFECANWENMYYIKKTQPYSPEYLFVWVRNQNQVLAMISYWVLLIARVGVMVVHNCELSNMLEIRLQA